MCFNLSYHIVDLATILIKHNGNDTQQFHTTPTSCAILPCVIVVCIGGLLKAVNWVVLDVYCMLMCMESEMLVAATECYCISMADMVCFVCGSCGVHKQYAESVWHVGV